MMGTLSLVLSFCMAGNWAQHWSEIQCGVTVWCDDTQDGVTPEWTGAEIWFASIWESANVLLGFLHMTAAKIAFWQSRQQRLFGQLSFRQLQTANVVRTLGSRNQNKPKQKSKRVEYNKAYRTSCSKLLVCCRVVLDQEAVSPQKQMCWICAWAVYEGFSVIWVFSLNSTDFFGKWSYGFFSE